MANKGEKPRRQWPLQLALLAFLGAWIYGLSLPTMNSGFDPVRRALKREISQAQQIYKAVQTLSLDDANTGSGKGGLPADAGVKSTREYIAYLVQRNAIKESDLTLFCKPGRSVHSLKELQDDDSAYCFANVAAGDPAGTVFIVSRNVVEDPSSKKEWNFSKDKPPQKPFVVLHLGGDGATYSKMPSDLKLPPREPHFLAP